MKTVTSKRNAWVLAFICYITIFVLSMVPSSNMVLDELPNEGDNFKSPDNTAVYHYSNGCKYLYDNTECYISKGNPPYGTSPNNGGIKVVERSLTDQIPLGGYVCSGKVDVVLATPIEDALSIQDFIYRVSDYGHFPAYYLLTLLLFMSLTKVKNPMRWAFILSFLGGGIIELAQGYFNIGRQASLGDLGLNIGGTCLALLILLYRQQRKKAA